MKLRSQLAFAFVLLSVVPLGGMSVYSYVASQRALRVAMEAQNAALAAEMSARMELVAAELATRLRRMRARDPGGGGAFERARRDALAAAEEAQRRELIQLVLAQVERRQGAIVFALDASEQLYTPEPGDVALLNGLGFGSGPSEDAGRPDQRDWVVVMREDADAQLHVGVARPVGEGLSEIRRTAVRNLAYGLGLVGLALLGILPLSRRMTRRLAALTEGAIRVSRGDLDVRVPVPRAAEFARLAEAFNHMAHELKLHQERLLAQERLRKELEIGRRIQSELLPREHLRVAFAEVGGVSIPAREVGGDFFNYFALPRERAAVLVGDVSGKGVPAALLMASLQATLRARLVLDDALADVAERLDRELDEQGPYLTLFVGQVDGAGRLSYVSAGHNTQLLLRGKGGVECLPSTGRPLGLLPGGGFEERCLRLDPGDALFLFTDGLVEAENALGEPFGMARLEALLLERGSADLSSLLAHVDRAVRAHRGGMEPADDATLLALRYGTGPA